MEPERDSIKMTDDEIDAIEREEEAEENPTPQEREAANNEMGLAAGIVFLIAIIAFYLIFLR